MRAGWELWLAENGGKLGGRDGGDRGRRRGRRPGDRDARAAEAAAAATRSTRWSASSTRPSRSGAQDLVNRVEEAADHHQRRRQRHHRRRHARTTSGARRSPTPRSPSRWASTSRRAATPSASTRSRPTTRPAPRSIAGFASAYKEGGGKSAGNAKPPFGRTSDYQPYLIAHPGAPAPKARTASSPAARRSTSSSSTRQFGLSDRIPLYGVGLPHRGQRADGAGRRRGGRADGAALQRPAGQPGQQGVRRGLPGQDGEPPSSSRCRPGTRPTCSTAPSARRPASAATRWPARWEASARSTTARAGRGPSTARPRRQNMYLRKVSRSGTVR